MVNAKCEAPNMFAVQMKIIFMKYFWDLSEILLSKVNNYNHDSYENCMSTNPKIAKYKGVLGKCSVILIV